MSAWKVLKSLEVFRTGFFRLRVDECELPDKRVMPKYFVMEFADWVNIVPVTKDGRMILVEQYRHGAGRTFLEIPGGGTHGNGEDPKLAGERELREETGYTSKRFQNVGFHYPNPALQNNKMHTFIAWDCERTNEQELDPFEDLIVREQPVAEVLASLDRGEFQHSLIASSLALAGPHLRKHYGLK